MLSDEQYFQVQLTNIHPSAEIGLPPEHRDYKYGTYHYGAYVPKSTKIGAYCTVDGGLDNATRIGERCFIMKGVHIGHDCVIGDDTEIAPHACIGGHVTIGRNVKIGMGAIIRNRTRIGDGAQIGCGAVVVKDVSPHTVVVGNPAGFLKMTYRLHTAQEDDEVWNEQFERSRA